MSAGHSISTFALAEGDEMKYFAMANNNLVPKINMTPREEALAPVYTYAFDRNPGYFPSRDALEALASAMHDNPAGDSNDSTIPAGYTYLIQFLFHDITHFSLRNSKPKNET